MTGSNAVNQKAKKDSDRPLHKNGDDNDDSRLGIDSSGDARGNDGDFERLTDGGDGTAKDVYEDGEAGLRREVFPYESSVAPRADFLFILDNSSSMAGILGKTRAGFASLASSDVWPEDTRIGVMTTMVGEGQNFERTHAVIKRYNGIDDEPGFLELVDRRGIERFLQVKPGARDNKYPLAGCDDGWFAPDDRADGGHSCFEAATQTMRFGVGAEPGAVAFAQLMRKNKDQRFFRKGAIVNVVFVSDTHDPGRDTRSLERPSYDELVRLAEKDNVMSGLRFHAIAPQGQKCTGEQLWDQIYNTLADASEGSRQTCREDDYVPVIRDIIEKGKVPQKPVFALGKKAREVVAVYVDDEKWDDWKLLSGDDGVEVKGLPEDEEVEVSIVYAYK